MEGTHERYEIMYTQVPTDRNVSDSQSVGRSVGQAEEILVVIGFGEQSARAGEEQMASRRTPMPPPLKKAET